MENVENSATNQESCDLSGEYKKIIFWVRLLYLGSFVLISVEMLVAIIALIYDIANDIAKTGQIYQDTFYPFLPHLMVFVVMFPPALYLYNYARTLTKHNESKDIDFLKDATRYLIKYFRFYGILFLIAMIPILILAFQFLFSTALKPK